MDNATMKELGRVWKWDADLMTCRGCNRSLIASRDGEPLAHYSLCMHYERKHPWRELREAVCQPETK